jgi:hypothetical protein
MSAADNVLASEASDRGRKIPPKQTRLEWGTLKLVRLCHPHPFENTKIEEIVQRGGILLSLRQPGCI